MTYTFKRRRGAQIAGCIALAALASVFLFQGLYMWPQAGAPVIGWICIGIAALFYALLIPICRETFTLDPMLAIGPEGLLYRPYSPETIPWSEISEIKLIRPLPRRGAYTPEEPPSLTAPLPPRPEPKDDPASMGLMFNVRDPARYRARGGFGNAMTAMGANMIGGIQFSMVKASTPEILAAIKAYWPNDIPIVTPSNPFMPIGGLPGQRDRSSK